jgi:hypothetical protein
MGVVLLSMRSAKTAVPDLKRRREAAAEAPGDVKSS